MYYAQRADGPKLQRFIDDLRRPGDRRFTFFTMPLARKETPRPTEDVKSWEKL